MHYYTAPGLSWHKCLKMIKVDLELFTNIDVLLLSEWRARGGVSMIVYYYVKGNMPSTTEYDPTQASRTLYIGMQTTFMHGLCLNTYPMEVLIALNLKIFLLRKFSNLNLMLLKWCELEESPISNEYSLALEPLQIKENMLTTAAKIVLQSKKFTSSTKLTPNLYNETNMIPIIVICNSTLNKDLK